MVAITERFAPVRGGSPMSSLAAGRGFAPEGAEPALVRRFRAEPAAARWA